MICKNFWCKAQFENKKGEELIPYCQSCRLSNEYPGQVEIVKENFSIGYGMKELMDLLNSKKNINKSPNKK